ncbi:hypothetical protein CAOG_00415 [Capsaspora owczarzaki ATCC 30864]|uniref:Uncharacterized protein n=1 Tax=Capsaspora owczarzaki (strain ATCC 30864) TaxID=595528 RepID=A0A0D2U0R7_CAPO3|nr:hypothetical protein CAOG_00415 [Capsaspora owczarzaki ATCC 30864]KJE88836.1 hypothetical protein CAOG_000415 [Capsaspora owczarzaki ATCC 30864]|eukprot:XP_004365286.2 hypothetical protein CAOG_00415 [Capsaspora owczarzaki ATCC 30864]
MDLEQLLHNLLSPENATRQASEDYFERIALIPEQLFPICTQYMTQSAHSEVRQMAIALFRRKAFALVGPDNDRKSLWMTTAHELREQVMAAFLSALQTETDRAVRRRIVDAVCDIANMAQDSDEEDVQWAALLPTLFALIQSEDATRRTSALAIINATPTVFGSQLARYIGVVHGIFADQMRAENDLETAEMAVRAAVGFMLFLNREQRNGFTDLLPLMLSVTSRAMASGDDATAGDVIGCLIELAEHSPTSFRNCFAEVVNTLVAAAGNTAQLEDGTRHLCVELLVTFAERHPGMCRRFEGFAGVVVPVLLQMMVEYDESEQAAVAWAASNSEVAEDEDETAIVGEQALDRIAVALGGKTLISAVLAPISQMLQSQDWRHRLGALMAISAIGEGAHGVLKQYLPEILTQVSHSLVDPNPRVRFGACNAIGQMATDFAPIIQEQYAQLFMNGVLPLLDETSFPRLQGHGSAALVNFTDIPAEAAMEMDSTLGDVLRPHLDAILTRLLNLLSTPHRFIHEQVITTIGIIADAVEESFVPYYNNFMPLLRTVLLDLTHDPEAAGLRGRVMECITLIGLAVGKDIFQQDAAEVMSILVAQPLSVEDPQLPYVLTAATRICKVLRKDFIVYLDAIWPALIAAASIQPELMVFEEDDPKAADFENRPGWESARLDSQIVSVRTSTLDDKATACEMLICIARELQELFAPRVSDIATLMLPLLRFYFHDGVRLAAACIMPFLIRSLVSAVELQDANSAAAQTQLAVVAPLIYDALIEAISLHSKDMVQMVTGFLDSFHLTLSSAGAHVSFPDVLYRKLADALIKQLAYDHLRVLDRARERQDEFYDEEMADRINETEREEQGVLQNFAETFHVLFQYQRENALILYEAIAPKLIEMIRRDHSPIERKWALCVYDDMLEFLGPVAWRYATHFLEPLLNGIQDENFDVLQTCAYGVGLMAKTGGPDFREFAAATPPFLLQMAQRPNARLPDNLIATDNVVSALGKIIEAGYVDQSTWLPAWFNLLPVESDITEAPDVYGFIANLLDQQNPIAVQHYPILVAAFCSVISIDALDAPLEAKLLHHLQTFSSSASAEDMQLFNSKLTEVGKDNLSSLNKSLAQDGNPPSQ